MAKNWEHAAGALWPTLTDAASKSGLLTYGELAPIAKTNPLSVGRALGPIQDYCLENRLPPLTAIVVGATSGVPGGGFIAWDVSDLDAAHEQVFNFNWSSVPNPYSGFHKDDTTDSLAQAIADNPSCAQEIYARVKVRGTAQAIFRAALMKIYPGCAFCGSTFENALDAAHIKPWHECSPSERLSLSNGLLLCATHHRLFDSAMMTLSESFKVVYYDPDGKDGDYTSADKALSIQLHSAKSYLPAEVRHRPSVKLLRWHHKHLEWGTVR